MSFHDSATPEDLPPSHRGDLWPVADEGEDLDSTDEPSEPADEPEPERYEETARYRESVIDAGRGHLVRHL